MNVRWFTVGTTKTWLNVNENNCIFTWVGKYQSSLMVSMLHKEMETLDPLAAGLAEGILYYGKHKGSAASLVSYWSGTS